MAKLEILLILAVAVLCCQAYTLNDYLRLDSKEPEPFDEHGNINWPLRHHAAADPAGPPCVDQSPSYCRNFRNFCAKRSYARYAEFVSYCRQTCEMCY